MTKLSRQATKLTKCCLNRNISALLKYCSLYVISTRSRLTFWRKQRQGQDHHTANCGAAIIFWCYRGTQNAVMLHKYLWIHCAQPHVFVNLQVEVRGHILTDTDNIWNNLVKNQPTHSLGTIRHTLTNHSYLSVAPHLRAVTSLAATNDCKMENVHVRRVPGYAVRWSFLVQV